MSMGILFRRLALATTLGVSAAALAACDNDDSTAENVGEAVEDVGDAAEDMADDAADAVEDAGDEVRRETR